jgi:hypothetical protein
LGEIKRLERVCGVQPVASFISAIELLGTAADPTHKKHDQVVRAISRVNEHTRFWDYEYVIPFVAPPDDQLSLSLFGIRDPEADNRAFVCGRALGTVAGYADRGEILPAALIDHLEPFRNSRDKEEERFAARMKAGIRAVDPMATGWQPFPANPAQRAAWITKLESGSGMDMLAQSLVETIAGECGRVLSASERDGMARWLRDALGPALHFYNSLVINGIRNGTNYSVARNANSVWDFMLMYMVSAHTKTRGLPLLFVSEEHQLLQVAREAGCQNRMATLSDYETRLRNYSEGTRESLL